MKKYVILLNEDVDLKQLLNFFESTDSIKLLGRYKDIMKIESGLSLKEIENIEGVRIAEEEILHFKS